MAGQIYGLIAQAMGKVGAIGKESTATNGSGKQMYKFRGIDAVYNALNPVMSELGLFICPEVLEQAREERKSVSGGNLIYSILKVKFTMYAPDGSNVSCVVIGEGMDSGDKASNKAMSVALKYACFEMLMIPTEEMVDPDGEVHETAPGSTPPAAPKQVRQEKVGNHSGQVSTAPTLPAPENPVAMYLARERRNLQNARQITEKENAELFTKQLAILRQNKLAPDKSLSAYTQAEAEDLIAKMYCRFTPTGTELKDE